MLSQSSNLCQNPCFLFQICTDCDVSCLECYGPSSTHCIDCPSGLLLKRLNVTHSSCVRCCSDTEDPKEDKCCKCNEERGMCGQGFIFLIFKYQFEINFLTATSENVFQGLTKWRQITYNDYTPEPDVSIMKKRIDNNSLSQCKQVKFKE